MTKRKRGGVKPPESVRLFLVGWNNKNSIVYFKDFQHGDDARWAKPMTLEETEVFLSELREPENAVVYQLVPYEIKSSWAEPRKPRRKVKGRK